MFNGNPRKALITFILEAPDNVRTLQEILNIIREKDLHFGAGVSALDVLDSMHFVQLDHKKGRVFIPNPHRVPDDLR